MILASHYKVRKLDIANKGSRAFLCIFNVKFKTQPHVP